MGASKLKEVETLFTSKASIYVINVDMGSLLLNVKNWRTISMTDKACYCTCDCVDMTYSYEGAEICAKCEGVVVGGNN